MAREAAPVLGLVSNNENYRQAPANIEAEQALLGAILVNNEALHRVNDGLQPVHFYEPVHQKIFEAIRRHNDRGQIANPVTLKHYFEQDEMLKEIGGAAYLVKLASAAVAVIDAAEYSALILDLAQKRSLISIGNDVVNTAYNTHEDREAGELIEEAEQQLFNLASEGMSSRFFVPIHQSVAEAIRSAELAYKRSGETVGLPTGIGGLNKLLGGLNNSDLVILAGRPSMGKTALALSIAHSIAKFFQQEHESSGSTAKPLSVGFFSLEMAAEQLASRLLSSDSGINASDIRKGNLDSDQFGKLIESSRNIARLPLYIDDTPALSVAALRARARRLKRVHNLGLIVVDYLQLMRGSSTKNDNRVQEVSEITMGLKAVAKELNVPVLALSQLSRQVESRDDKRPQLSDLRESGSIEQDADVVMFVYREEYYLMRKQPDPERKHEEHARWQEDMDKVHGLAEIIVSKHRHGPIGNIVVAFHADQARFADLEQQHGY
jgi:replicative DNA helicase